jgi:hypothetical protein
MTEPKIISQCAHEAAEPAPEIELPAHLGATERNIAARCRLCSIIFMAVKPATASGDGIYRDYRDVDFGGRRP